MAQRKQQQAGFTLVELVIVILILGILSAVALPRFYNLGSDARKAKTQAIYGSVRAASQIVRAAALVQNKTVNATGDTVTLDGTSVNLVYGYPEASNAGIIAAAALDTTNDGISVATAAGVTTITISGATTAATCQVTFTQATSAAAGASAAMQNAGC